MLKPALVFFFYLNTAMNISYQLSCIWFQVFTYDTLFLNVWHCFRSVKMTRKKKLHAKMMREFFKKFLYDFSREKYTYISLVFASIALNLTELVQTFRVPFYKLLRVEDFWNRKNVSRVCSPCFFRSVHNFSMGLRSVLCDDPPVQRPL